jgi:Mg-chelatase subunit ChlD
LQVNDGYFVHFFAPTNLKPLHKHVVFVLDVSGSMGGRKIEQLKEAMTAILDDLNDGDYFNIIEFSYSVTVMIHPGIWV